MTHMAVVMMEGRGAFNQGSIKPRLWTTGLGRLLWDYTHLHRPLSRKGSQRQNMTKKQTWSVGSHLLWALFNRQTQNTNQIINKQQVDLFSAEFVLLWCTSCHTLLIRMIGVVCSMYVKHPYMFCSFFNKSPSFTLKGKTQITIYLNRDKNKWINIT